MSHSVLLSKLSAYGIKGVELEWFTNYLVVNSKWLFKAPNLSVNLLVVECPKDLFWDLYYFYYISMTLVKPFKSEVLMFADDTVVFYVGKSAEETESVLNTELENVFRCCIKNDLIVNLRKGKTEALLFGTRRGLNTLHGKLALKFGPFE